MINARKIKQTVQWKKVGQGGFRGRVAAHLREFRTLVLRCPYGAQVEMLRATGAGDEKVGSRGSEAVGATSQGAGGRRWVPLEPSSCWKRKGTGQGSEVPASVWKASRVLSSAHQ